MKKPKVRVVGEIVSINNVPVPGKPRLAIDEKGRQMILPPVD